MADRSQGSLVVRRILRNPIAVAGLAIILGYLFIAAFAPHIAPFDPTAQDLSRSFAPISAGNPMGCDEFGRDILSRIIFGARTSLIIQFFSVCIALVI